MKGPAKLTETNILQIHEAEVTGVIQIDGVEIHVGGIGEGGCFVAHKTRGEGTDLIKGQLVVRLEDVEGVPHVHILVIIPIDSLRSGVD